MARAERKGYKKWAKGSSLSFPFAPRLLHSHVESGRIESFDQLHRIEVAFDCDGVDLRLGIIACDSVNLLDCLLDDSAALWAAIVQIGHGEALDFAFGDAAIVLHRQVFLPGIAVETAGGPAHPELFGPPYRRPQ